MRKLPDELLQEVTEVVANLIKAHLRTGRFTDTFLAQLIFHATGRALAYGGRPEVFDIHSIFDAIAALEGTGRRDPTKSPTQFQSGPLEGLWHKHFLCSSVSSFARNIRNEIEKDDVWDKLWHVQLQQHRKAAGLEAEDRVEQLAGAIAHTFVTDAHLNRLGVLGKRPVPNRMTGEWIIYAKGASNENVYLTIATHFEAETDCRSIVERCEKVSA